MTPNDVPRSSGKRPSSSRGYFRRRTGQGARLPGRAGRVRATQTGVESVSHNVDRRLLGTNGDSLRSRAPRAWFRQEGEGEARAAVLRRRADPAHDGNAGDQFSEEGPAGVDAPGLRIPPQPS